jgi:arginyl-tRNA synthetase
MDSFTDRKAFALIQDEFSRCMGVEPKDAPAVTFCAHPEKADFSMMVAKFAKTIKTKPNEFAASAAEKINSFAEKKFIKSASAEGIYLNFKVDRAAVYDLTYETVIKMGDKYGSSTLPEQKTVAVEHTSANPNAALHIGNLRSVLIGAHLARLLKWVGYNVHELYFVNDLGAQIGLTAVGYGRLKTLPEGYKIDHLIGLVYSIMNTLNSAQKLKIKFSQLREHFASYTPKEENEEEDENDQNKPKTEKTPEQEIIDTACRLHHFHPELYDQLNDCFKDDESIYEIAAKLNQDYEAKEPEAVKIIRGMTNATLTGIQQTLDIYNVHHDRFDYESEISWEGTSDALLKALQKSAFFHPETQCNAQGKPEGAYFDIDAYLKAIKAKQGKGGYQKPYPNFYLIRPDGTTLYTFRDVAYSMKKISQADMVLNCICTEQNLPQEKVVLTLQALGIEKRAQFHMAYEMVKLMKDGKIKRMSSRKGISYLADDLYEDLKQATKKVMADREKQKVDMSDEQSVEKIAHTVANASMKYTLLGISPRNAIEFDIGKAVDPTGDSASFILYTGARVSSIITKFEKGVKEGKYKPEPEVTDWSLIVDDPIAWEILTKYVMSFASETIRAAIPEIPPAPKLPEFGTHIIPAFSYQLARLFSTFYGTRPNILNAEDPQMYPRIKLCRMLLQTLNNAMRLFMVEPLDEM